jgi:plastocyanin
MRIAAMTVALTVGAALAACSSSTTGPSSGGTGGTSQTITLSSTMSGGSYGNFFFSPNPDTVTLNSPVTFAFGSVPHDMHVISGPNGAVLPDSIVYPTSNTNIERTFTTAGTYTIECTFHHFTGIVVVH